MASAIMNIYKKEFREVIRDRRTVFFMLIMPTVLLPLIMGLVINYVTKTEIKAQTRALKYAIFGADNLPQLAKSFEAGSFQKVELTSGRQIRNAVRNHEIDFALVIPASNKKFQIAGSQPFSVTDSIKSKLWDLSQQLAEESGFKVSENIKAKLRNPKQINVRLYYDNSSAASYVKQRVSLVISQFSQQYRSQLLASLGITDVNTQKQIITPVTIEHCGIAGFRQVVGENFGAILPYLFIILCFMGALYPAVDIGAGEKERGTLETLILAPVKPLNIVLGKFLVVFTTGIITALLTLCSLAVMISMKGEKITGPLGSMLKQIQVGDYLLIASMLIPIAAIIAAMLLAISVYAKSYKEAQTYCAPLNGLIIIPAVISLLPGVKLDWKWACVPITNISLAIRDLLKGTIDYPKLSAIMVTSFILAALMVWFCTRWFQREQVLFRQ